MTTPRKLKILCDLDSILVEFLPRWLERYNALYQDHVVLADVTDWHMHHVLKRATSDQINDIIAAPDFFEDLPPLAGGCEAVQKLVADGHDVYIATSQASPESAMHKFRWVAKHLPFLAKDPSKKVFIGQPKWMIRADVLIDDSTRNLLNHRREWPDTKLISVRYPFHHTLPAGTADLLADDYRDTESAWEEIYGYIDGLARGTDFLTCAG